MSNAHTSAGRVASAAIFRIRKLYGKAIIKDRNISIIANNCIGADICHSLGLRFNSPTVNMQICPEDYVRFVSNLGHYVKADITECVEMTIGEDMKVRRLYGRGWENLGFPFGRCEDILLCFQHFSTFKEAKAAWNRRKQRINYDKLGLVFIVSSEYEKEMLEFDRCNINAGNKLIFQLNFENDEEIENSRVCHVRTPKGVHFMEQKSLTSKYYEQEFKSVEWINSL